MKIRRHIFALLLSLMIAGCANVSAPASTQSPLEDWKSSHILLLDPHETGDPAQDLLALYFRQSPERIQFRLDFLDIDPNALPSFQMDVEFDLLPGSARSDKPRTFKDAYRIRLVNGLEPAVLAENQGPVSGLSPNVYWQTDLDYVVVEIDDRAFSSARRLKNVRVDILPGDDPQQALSTPIVTPGPLGSNFKASLALEFWDVMPGFTPAQTLRRWDGAHTGPYGQRHGLRYLLQAVESSGVPVSLLDLKKPNSLAALSYIQQLGRVQELETRGLLILPDAGYGNPASAPQSLALSRRTARGFGFSEEAIAFAPLSPESETLQSYRVAFAALPGTDRVYRWQGLRLIPLPEAYTPAGAAGPEIDRDGLTVEAKRRLIEAAASGDAGKIIVFGGSLPASAWGDAQSSRLAMEYIRTHPWIRALSREDLLSFPVSGTYFFKECTDLLCTPPDPPLQPFTSTGLLNTSSPPYAELKRAIRNEIQSLPQDELADIAWQMYFNLSQPSQNTALVQLQTNYLGGLGHLIAAIRWANHPQSQSTCSVDLDWDGENECVLSNERLFTSYEAAGARLVTLFSKGEGGVEQWFGPASQFAIGLSDPHDWKPEGGPAADPNEIPGAFSELTDTYRPFSPHPSNGRIDFQSGDGRLQKSFYIESDHLTVDFHTTDAISTRIPLLIYSRARLAPNWTACLARAGEDPAPGCPALPQYSTRSANVEAISFYDSFSEMQLPENPSFGYPPGHYLPFPFSLMTLSGQGNFSIEFTFPP